MRIFFPLLVLVCCSVIAQAQKNGSVKGVAYDTLAQRPVPDATITVLAKKDSSLVSFSMTDYAERFYIDNSTPGDYRLLVTHVAYHNTNKEFKIDADSKQVELGRVLMNDKAKVLQEVVIQSEAP